MKLNQLCVSLLAVVLAVSAAMALEAGPGGRIYTTSFNWDTKETSLQSVAIDANWNVGAVQQQLTFADNAVQVADASGTGSNYSKWHVFGGITPNIKVSNPSGYATVTMGFYGPTAPASRYAAATYVTHRVLQIADIQTSASGASMNIIGAGRRYNWDNKDTDSMLAVAYDATGAATGYANSYLGLKWDRWGSARDVIHPDADGGDITEADSNYMGNNWQGHEIGALTIDQRVAGNRVYVYSHLLEFPAPLADTRGIGYYNSDGIGGLENHLFYSNVDPMSGSATPVNIAPFSKIAAGKVVKNGAPCDAVWFYTSLANGALGLAQAVDLDGDGMAYSAGEVSVIYSNGMGSINLASPDASEAGNGDWTAGLDLVTNANGTQFLMIAGKDRLNVMQLTADGLYADSAVLSTPGIGFNLRADAAVPEPATMALLGLGSLGALLRRRN